MTHQFHMAAYDTVGQVVKTRYRRRKTFSHALKRVRSHLQGVAPDTRIPPLVLRGLDRS
jgi:hypothetical protein